MVPALDFSTCTRQAYLVRWDEDPDSDEGMIFVQIAMSVLRAGDYFTLETQNQNDPLYGLVATERLFKATSDAFLVDGVPQIECERV